MAISEYINPDQLNIHQFQEAPEARSKAPFDPERDIDAETKDRLLDRVVFYDYRWDREDPFQNVTDSVCIQKGIKLLWPHELIQHSFSEGELISAAQDLKGKERHWSYAVYISNLKIVHPDLDVKFDQGLLISSYKNFKQQGDYPDVLTFLTHLKIIDPIIFDRLIEEDRQQFIDLFKTEMESEPLTTIAQIASDLRLIDSSFKPELTFMDWEELRKILDEYKTDQDLFRYTRLANNLKILAAHSVKITAPGVIDIQMYPPADINQSTPPMPESRKF